MSAGSYSTSSIRMVRESLLFRREHHRRIGQVLHGLDGELLRRNSCYFGGGTAITLRLGEYRLSDDIDFLVSSKDGYRALRELVKADGLGSLGSGLVVARDARADQYGIRGAFRVDGDPIKFEIIHEGRIDFDEPSETDRVDEITTLSAVDTVASKLLANDDRWPDRGVLSRDIIDLAMLAPSPELFDQGRRKAIEAYGAGIRRTFASAISLLLDDDEYRARCVALLQMTVTEDELACRLELLRNSAEV